MDKIIKHLEFVLENSEVIVVPYQCFKNLSINGSEDLWKLKSNDAIVDMECDIKNYGLMIYRDEFNNQTSPIDRLNNSNDICIIRFIHDDDTSISMRVEWYQDENNYYNQPQYNENQTSNKLDYNSIHIEIKPYVKTYSIQEVFEFHVGTIVEMIDNGIFIVDKYESGKCFKDVVFTDYLVNGMYRIIQKASK